MRNENKHWIKFAKLLRKEGWSFVVRNATEMDMMCLVLTLILIFEIVRYVIR